ncbi:MAG TPA: SPFH domain-containing protein, partial [Phycisphaerae bacterium]|nr:SPFH domain-containing protein [Phycisphaerae bacterium]
MKEQARGRKVAILGAVTQAAVLVAAIIVWLLTGSQAMLNSVWFLLGGLSLWVMTAVLFYARQKAWQEEMELREIAASGQADTIFDEEHTAEFQPAARRLKFMQKWLVPILTLLLAGYYIATGVWMLQIMGRTAEQTELTSIAPGIIFLLISGFLLFLMSKYAVGMSSNRQWRLLHAPGSYSTVCALMLALLAVSLFSTTTKFAAVHQIMAWIIVAAGMVYSVESVLNIVLDIYRPRRPGDEYRPGYDSRIFALVAEPGKVGHSIADTLNYQFGFEVSKTWFYKLVSRAFVPLIIFGFVVMILLSGVVIVSPGEVFVIKTLGRVPSKENTLGPGMHFKWPWPIAIAQRFNTGLIQQLILGVGGMVETQKTSDGQELVLWTQVHGYAQQEEQDFLIAVPPRESSKEDAPSTISIIKLVVALQYQITDVYKYGYNYVNAADTLKCIAEQEMVEYCASATLDTKMPGDDTSRPQAIMNSGRLEAAANLQKLIQKRLDDADMGVKILFVGIISAHPPAEAVPQFEKVLEAERLQDQQRYEAQAKASKILAGISGDPDKAMKLFVDLYRAEIFDKLNMEKGTPTFTVSINEFIRKATEQVNAMTKEIDREKLLGRDVPGMENLRNAYENLRSQLVNAQTNP